MGKNVPLDQVAGEILKRLDKGTSSFVLRAQREFSDASPYETGRLASSWVIGEGAPNRYVEPEREVAGDVTLQSPSEPIVWGENYYVSSNIPYASTLALDPSFPIKTAPKDWFTATQNQLPQMAADEYAKAFRGF